MLFLTLAFTMTMTVFRSMKYIGNKFVEFVTISCFAYVQVVISFVKRKAIRKKCQLIYILDEIHYLES